MILASVKGLNSNVYRSTEPSRNKMLTTRLIDTFKKYSEKADGLGILAGD